MKILKKQEVRKISIDESTDIDSKDLMELCRKCTAEPYSFLVIDNTLPSDNASLFWKNLLEVVWRVFIQLMKELEIKNCSIGINRATVNISTLTLSKIGKYKYLISEEILPTQHHIEKAVV